MLEETLAQEKYIGDILPSSENLRESTVEEISGSLDLEKTNACRAGSLDSENSKRSSFCPF